MNSSVCVSENETKGLGGHTDYTVWSDGAGDGVESCVGRVAEDEMVAVEV